MIDTESLKLHMYDVIGALHTVHHILGPGLNEYCYQEALGRELQERGIRLERERCFHPNYKGVELLATYRTDFICKGDIIVECKAVGCLNAVMRAQLFNYMRILKMPSGIIVNFLPRYAEIERYFYDADTRNVISVTGQIMF